VLEKPKALMISLIIQSFSYQMVQLKEREGMFINEGFSQQQSRLSMVIINPLYEESGPAR
jgi:hypothetical protein